MNEINLEYRLKGYSYVMISGKQIQRFLNICAYHEIHFRKLELEKHAISAIVKNDELSILKDLGIKHRINIKIKKTKGLPYLFSQLQNRWGFVLGVFWCYLFLFYMSGCVWEIDFSGNQYHTDDSLLHYLKEYGIIYGTRMNQINCEAAELELRSNYSDVAWCCIQKEGCKLIVTITETNSDMLTQQNQGQNNNATSIVSDKDAIISHMVTGTGTPMVTYGQEVKKGDVLVEGYITYYDDYDKVIGYQGVCAQAEIRGIYKISYEERVEFNADMADTTLTIYHPIEPLDKLFPYCYRKETILFPQKEKQPLDYETAVVILENKLYEQIKKWEENGYEVIEKNLKMDDNKIEVVQAGVVWVEGPIGRNEPCTIPNLSEDMNESYGN